MNEAPLKSEQTVVVDREKKRIYIRFEGYFNLEQVRQLYEDYRAGIAEVGSGYTVLTYFKDFTPGNEEVQDVISDMIVMASKAGCRRAARIGGGSVLGPLQLRRLSNLNATYDHDYFDNLDDAEAYLDAD
ncbi:MAG: hypothetical protein GY906_02610 [bacterium]|nr:hypothetical protein [bacterium]